MSESQYWQLEAIRYKRRAKRLRRSNAAKAERISELESRQSDKELANAITFLKKTTGFLPGPIKQQVMDFIEENSNVRPE